MSTPYDSFIGIFWRVYDQNNTNPLLRKCVSGPLRGVVKYFTKSSRDPLSGAVDSRWVRRGGVSSGCGGSVLARYCTRRDSDDLLRGKTPQARFSGTLQNRKNRRVSACSFWNHTFPEGRNALLPCFAVSTVRLGLHGNVW